MKRLVVLLFCFFALLSCEGPMGPQGLPGEGGSKWFVETYTVKSADWELVGGEPDELGTYYMYEFDEPALTDFIFKKGNVMGYLVETLRDGSEVQTPLPCVIHKAEVNAGVEHLWTETYTFDFMQRSVAFYVRYSDFYTGNLPPTCKFRLVMTW